MSHSATAGTSHRGNVITSLHGLPVQFTPVQEAMNLPPACPDWHDHREHIDGTMPSRPGEVHRVYASGKVVKTFPVRKVWNPERQAMEDLGLQAANICATRHRRAATTHSERVQVTVDPWCPVVSFSDAHTTRPFEFQPGENLRAEMKADGYDPDDPSEVQAYFNAQDEGDDDEVPYDDELHSPE